MKEGKRLDPSTRSPSVRMVSAYARLFTVKFSVFTLPSSAGYMKSIMRMPFSVMNLRRSARVNSPGLFWRKATTSFGLSVIVLSIVVICGVQIYSFPADLARLFPDIDSQ